MQPMLGREQHYVMLVKGLTQKVWTSRNAAPFNNGTAHALYEAKAVFRGFPLLYCCLQWTRPESCELAPYNDRYL